MWGVGVLVKAALPFKHQVCCSGEALPDVDHASQEIGSRFVDLYEAGMGLEVSLKALMFMSPQSDRLSTNRDGSVV